MAGFCIMDDEACCEASKQEIIRRYYHALNLYSICSFAQQQSIPVPKPHQLKWHEAEMGEVFHYDLHVFDGIRYGQGDVYKRQNLQSAYPQ